MYNQQRLIELIRQEALKFGEFTLASGKTASYYLDCRRITLNGEGANQIAEGILDRLKNRLPVAVGGMAIGADPVTAAVITCGWQRGYRLKGFIVRKEPKSHGTSQMIEGPVTSGDTAVVLEDVVTTGGSSVRAIEHARGFGLVVEHAIAIVDRQQGAKEKFDSVGVQFDSLLTIGDLGI